MNQQLVFLIALLLQALQTACRSKGELVLENLALRQQVTALKQKHPQPHLHDNDRVFWLALRRGWARWADLLVIVKPETVVDWHRRRFRRHWTKISRRGRRPGRRPIDAETRDLIRRMAAENNWGAPRIHSELVMLGLEVSQSSVSRYIRRFIRQVPDPAVVNRWVAFLRNHKDAIAGMDFFTVPTIRLRVLYVFFVIDHGRRHILHFNATYNPTAQWVVQQLREAFPFDTAPKYLIFDRDSIFNKDVVRFIKSVGTKPSRTAYRSPWQNPVAERWIGTCRREMLGHAVVFGERHAVQLVRSFVDHYHADRGHMGLGGDVPDRRPVISKPSPAAKVVSLPRVGGLHHRYEWRDAA